MAKELIDRVDISDRVVGVTNKQEAHEKGYVHRVSVIYAWKNKRKNRILIQLRKKDWLLDHSCGGHVNVGESYYHAAVRELYEELHIQRTRLRPIGTFLSDERFRRNANVVHMFSLFETDLRDEDKIRLQKDEVASVADLSLEDMRDGMTYNPQMFTPGSIMAFNFFIGVHPELGIKPVSPV